MIIGNGSPQQAQWFREATGINTPIYTDPDLKAYGAITARRGMSVVLHPMVVVRAFQAMRQGFRQAGIKGDATQVGGLLIIKPDGSIPYLYLSSYAGDTPSPAAILQALKKACVAVT